MKYLKSNAIIFSSGFIVVLIIIAVLSFSKNTEAKVRGQCANCHTMHNSQDGADMVDPFGDEVNPAGVGTGTCSGCHVTPRENLLKLSCIGCHAMDITSGSALPVFDTVYEVPQIVYNTAESLAAGNFKYVFTDDNYGHNVHGFSGTGAGDAIERDSNIFMTTPDMPVPGVQPPGYHADMDYGSPHYDQWPITVPQNGLGQVMCAGAFGCHGNRRITSQSRAIAGAHHANDADLQVGSINLAGQGGTTGTSYRFLSGVTGGEHDRWEYDADASDHNVYSGQDNIAAAHDYPDINTMSELCAGCHGRFHMAGATGLGNPSPWIRHPSDVLIADEAPYNQYVTYQLEVPVARVTIDNTYPSSTAWIAGESVVFCLSCHRAHASSENDSLRFSYDNIVSGGGSGGSKEGCFACHSDK